MNITEIASGVDAVYASSRAPVNREFFKSLSDLKAMSNSAGDIPMLLDLMGHTFLVGSRSWGRYPIYVENDEARIGFTDKSSIPGVRIQLRSSFIHSVGAREALDYFSGILKGVDVLTHWTFSRLDLYADVMGWDLSETDEPNFQSRGSAFSSFKEKGQFTGFTFGKRKTGTFNARIYDKTAEIEKNHDGWRPLIWEDRHIPGERVLRIEFEVHTKGFANFDVKSADEGFERQGAIWAYLTDNWLTHRIPGTDLNKSRWEVSKEWKVIQNVSLRGTQIPIERIKKGMHEASLTSLIAPARGFVTSIGVLLGAKDYEECMEATMKALWRGERKLNKTAEHLIAEKKLRFLG
jgi:hypothetical protein